MLKTGSIFLGGNINFSFQDLSYVRGDALTSIFLTVMIRKRGLKCRIIYVFISGASMIISGSFPGLSCLVFCQNFL